VPTPTDPRARAEAWFLEHGLPYFVDELRSDVRRRLQRSRVVVVLVVALVLGTVAAVAVGLLAARDGGANGFTTGATVALVVMAVYALRALQTGTIARWAGGRALGSLGLLVPLATRALPMLLLFITFLFINTEVWQVASALQRSALWGIALLFSGVAVAFLLAQLPQELSKVMDEVTDGGVEQACEGTPLEPWAAQAATAAENGDGDINLSLSPRQRANLLLVLLIAQAFQVVLLAAAVCAFFVLFGLVAIDDSVIKSWVGEQAPTSLSLFQRDLSDVPISNELFQVSLFLAAFSGLYFTVYAVSDPTYREQFFTHVSADLEHAVGVRAVYETLQPSTASSSTSQMRTLFTGSAQHEAPALCRHALRRLRRQASR